MKHMSVQGLFTDINPFVSGRSMYSHKRIGINDPLELCQFRRHNDKDISDSLGHYIEYEQYASKKIDQKYKNDIMLCNKN